MEQAATLAMFLVYGDPKRGKTTLFLRAFPGAVVIGVRANIELVAPASGVGLPAWIVEDVRTLSALAAWLRFFTDGQYHRTYPAVIIDDFSQLCETSMVEWRMKAPIKNGGPDINWVFAQLDQHLDMIGNLARHLGVPVGLSAHEQKPDAGKGKVGAPLVPSKNQVQAIPGWVDYVGRIVPDDNYPDPFFKRVLWVDPGDSNWISGDRSDISWTNTPPSLREILAAAGHRLPRPATYDWVEPWVEQVASAYVQVGPDRTIEVADWLWGRVAPAPLSPADFTTRWLFQEGLARGVLRQRHSGGLLGRLRADRAARAAAAPPPPPPPTTAPAPGVVTPATGPVR